MPALQRIIALLDRSDDEQGKAFGAGAMMVPHLDSRRYGWTHYGVMIPDLPAPHRFFTLMSILGSTGSLAIDTDHALTDTPRRTATVVTGTAATHPAHFRGYSIPRDCEIAADGSLIRLGQDVEIRGRYPEYTVKSRAGEAHVSLTLRATDKVSWFIKNPVYDHLSLLAEYEGSVRTGGDHTPIRGLCTFEYAACASVHTLVDRRMPAALKLPLDFFTYQVVALDARTQLLLVSTGFLGRPMMTTAYVRSLDAHGQTYRDVDFELLEQAAIAGLAPDGRLVRVPKRFRWVVRDRGATILTLEGSVDTPMTYGLGSGSVGGYGFEARRNGAYVSGRGYIEYIDRRGRPGS